MPGVAPVKLPVTEGNYLTQGWLQHLTEISDTLRGEWGTVGPKAMAFNPLVDEVRGEIQGNVLHLILVLNDFTSSQGDKLTWEFPFSAKPTILDVYQESAGTYLTSEGCYVEDKTITLPALSASKVFIKGTLLRK